MTATYFQPAFVLLLAAYVISALLQAAIGFWAFLGFPKLPWMTRWLHWLALAVVAAFFMWGVVGNMYLLLAVWPSFSVPGVLVLAVTISVLNYLILGQVAL